MAPLASRQPRFSTRETELLARQIGVCFMAYGLYYLVWRIGWTLNLSALWLALPLVAAEAMGFIDFCLFLFMSWHIPGLKSEPPPEGLSVDVYITTYNESTEILRSSILGAVNMRYPHATYVLDDGARADVAALAKALGARYIARSEHEHAKAGNINHALTETSGDFIAVFDADHVPHPQFLERTLQYFTEERVALVQTPQEFYNLDSIQHASAKHEGEAHWHEQALFYRVIQPGKDRSNAAFWCGSSAVLRRSALEAIGGVATETITEDILTTIKLHAAGWRTAYHNEILATGIAPDDLDAFLTQRKRWAQGAMQILRSRYNPLWTKGLTDPPAAELLGVDEHVLRVVPEARASADAARRAGHRHPADARVRVGLRGALRSVLRARTRRELALRPWLRALLRYGAIQSAEGVRVRAGVRRAGRATLAAVRSDAQVAASTARAGNHRRAAASHAAREQRLRDGLGRVRGGHARHRRLAAAGARVNGYLGRLQRRYHWARGPSGALALSPPGALSLRPPRAVDHRRAVPTGALPGVIDGYDAGRAVVYSTRWRWLGVRRSSSISRLPGDARLQSSALVMNSVPLASGGPFRVGVQFTELSDAERDALTLYLFTGETDRTHGQSDEELAAA